VVAASTAAAAALLWLAVVAFILSLELLHLSYQSCVGKAGSKNGAV
jgi:hypothetical protein